MRNGYPAPHCPLLPPVLAPSKRLRDFVDGWGAGWLFCWGPGLVVMLAQAWGWL